MNLAISARLSAMMFIQFFIWGSWYVTGPRYLTSIGFTGSDFGLMYSVGPIAGIISPFFVGMIADRFFSTERVLAAMHLLAGVAMLGAAQLMKVPDPNPLLINLVFFAHMLCYFPTLALVNSLSMHNMTDSEKEFPLIRVFGTIGWIVAGLTLSGFPLVFWLVTRVTEPGSEYGVFQGAWDWGNTVNQFYIVSGAAILLGLYSLTLPHTPPPMRGQKVSLREVFGVDAFVLLKRRSFLTFIICSFLICIPLAFYYQLGERAVAAAQLTDPPFKMTFGQMSEILFMVLMPFFFVRLGVKWMLLVGMLAWVVRYALFAIGAPEQIAWMMLTGVILHGICYDFFFVTGQIYTDKAAPKAIRGQAQGMLVLFTLGLGMLIGAQVAGYVEELYTPQEALTLREQAEEAGGRAAELQEQAAEKAGEVPESLASEIEELQAKQIALNNESLQLMNWRKIWTIPAVLAGVIMILFGVIFKDEVPARDVDEEDVAAAAAREELT